MNYYLKRAKKWVFMIINQNKFFFLGFLLLHSFLSVSATTFYVDKDNRGGNGANDSWPGTQNEPKADIEGDWFRRELKPGDTVVIRQASSYGEMRFYPTSSGDSSNPVVVMPFPGDTIIMDSEVLSSQFGIRVLSEASFIHIHGPMRITGKEYSYVASYPSRGLVLSDAMILEGQHGPRLDGLADSKFLNIEMRDLSVNGFQMRGSESASTGEPCKRLWIENVRAYNIDDNRSPENSDADGFHSYGGEDIVFKNCVANDNAEDGFDLNANAILINSTAMNNKASGLKVWRRENDDWAEKTITVVNGIFAYNGIDPDYPDDTNPGIKVSMGARLNLLQSVVYGNYDQAIHFRVDAEGSSVDGPFALNLPYQTSHVYNSLLLNTRAGSAIRDGGHPDGPIVQSDYNLYDGNPQVGQGFTPGENSILGIPPEFQDTTRFVPLSEDTFLNRGLALDTILENLSLSNSYLDSLTSVYLTQDYLGKDRGVKSTMDIGPYLIAESDTSIAPLFNASVGLPENWKEVYKVMIFDLKGRVLYRFENFSEMTNKFAIAKRAGIFIVRLDELDRIFLYKSEE